MIVKYNVNKILRKGKYKLSFITDNYNYNSKLYQWYDTYYGERKCR